MFRIVSAFTLLMFLCLGQVVYASSKDEKKKIVRIATGSIIGSYYSIGIRICSYIEEALSVKCDVVPSSGSKASLDMLDSGEVEFAFVPANFAIDAYEATGIYSSGKPERDLRQILKLQDEVITLLAKDDDEILSFGDLEGKKIAIGPSVSDSNTIYNMLSESYNFRNSPVVHELSVEKYAEEFCNGNIDVVLLMSSHPSAIVSHITNNCDAEFLLIGDELLNSMLKRNKGFKIFAIDPDNYPGTTMLQKTISSSALLVTRINSMNHKDFKLILDKIDANLDIIKKSHPCLYGKDIKDFTKDFVLPDIRKENLQ